MAQRPGMLPRFWQELKRRKVIKVVAMYAATAFIILEAADIILPRLGLPDWTVTFLIILLAAGFPITVILSWIFDITPEGVKKTESIEAEYSKAPPSNLKARRITSNLVILVLFVAVCILLYPKIFKMDKFEEIRDEDGRISVAVLPFENLTGDSLLDFWENGISEYLINGLGNSKELAVLSSRAILEVLQAQREVSAATMSPSLARETARRINAGTYISGNVIGSGKNFSIMVNLENTESGELLWSSKVEGDLKGDYRFLLETLNDTIKNYLEIKALEESVERELMEAYPNSAEAYRYYIEGFNAMLEQEYGNAIESLLKAVELDSSFTLATFYLAWSYLGANDSEMTYYWTRRAYDLKDQIPSKFHPWLDLWYSCIISEDGKDIRRSLSQLEKSGLNSRLAWFDLGVTYTDWLGEYDKGIEAYEKIEELNREWDSDWDYVQYYREYAWVMVMAGKPEEVERIVLMGLKVNPDDYWLDVMRGARSVFLGDSSATKKHIENFRSAVREDSWPEPRVEYWIGHMFCWGRDSIAAEKYFRRAYELYPERLYSLGMLTRILTKFDLDLEEGLALSEIGLSNNPESFSFRYSKAIALHKMGRHEEALVLMKEADEKRIGYSRHLESSIEEVEKALAIQNN